MAKYATLADCADMLVVCTAQHLQDADVFVDLALQARGIDPADLVLPNPTLTSIAVAWAKRQAAVDGANGPDSPLVDKARQYEATAKILAAKLSRPAVGLATPAGAGFGQFGLGRS